MKREENRVSEVEMSRRRRGGRATQRLDWTGGVFRVGDCLARAGEEGSVKSYSRAGEVYLEVVWLIMSPLSGVPEVVWLIMPPSECQRWRG